ncbi:MAG: ISL3 family transposase [Jatrophihabitans sp.]
MDDATSVLFDLPGFVVIECVELDDDARRTVIMQVAVEHGCPRCGVVVGGKPYDTRESRIKDLPFGERSLVVIWRKRRYRCPETSCGQKLFVERSSEIAARRRSSERLRRKLAQADGQCRAYSQVAVEYGVSWWLVNDVAARAAAELPVEPPAVRWLGIDETRTRRPRWRRDPVTGSWRREEPWMTSLTNLDTSSARAILGLTPGRSSATVCTWLAAREQSWRDGIEVVAIDPCAAYAKAVRQALPQATIVVDHFHLDRLANDMVTKVRRRVTWDNRDRRGRLVDPEWANRRRLLTAKERLAPARFAKMWNSVSDGDPSGQILAAYIAKEHLRALLALARRRPTWDMISNAKYRFAAWCALFSNIGEIVTLAETIETWWPEIEAFLRLNITNARTEGSNRTIKQIKRVGCGFANQANYERRILAYATARDAA